MAYSFTSNKKFQRTVQADLAMYHRSCIEIWAKVLLINLSLYFARLYLSVAFQMIGSALKLLRYA